MFVVRSVWEQLQDMSPVLEEMRDKGIQLGGEEG
jgi:hypothetical protein